MFSDVGPLELITIVILATILFGPDKLPEIIQNVAGFLRKVRELSASTQQEIRDELGPEFKDFEFEDLHPKTFVRKHLLDGKDLGLDEIRSLDPRRELMDATDAAREAAADTEAPPTAPERTSLTKNPPTEPTTTRAFDPDAT
ncbi:sec-independent translocase [Streptomyces colonosanans]|uniref:Preprotein translocase n=1 Tax=Streptomyces colonosanans TaxID=1428652 RepID=A0A1S2PX70_9ACTN|nr:sec-independent translocase [Streptomyces colonosanans]OIJ98437.1 preprotein translocase [Streptomyces colonosanans]